MSQQSPTIDPKDLSKRLSSFAPADPLATSITATPAEDMNPSDSQNPHPAAAIAAHPERQAPMTYSPPGSAAPAPTAAVASSSQPAGGRPRRPTRSRPKKGPTIVLNQSDTEPTSEDDTRAPVARTATTTSSVSAGGHRHHKDRTGPPPHAARGSALEAASAIMDPHASDPSEDERVRRDIAHLSAETRAARKEEREDARERRRALRREGSLRRGRASRQSTVPASPSPLAPVMAERSRSQSRTREGASPLAQEGSHSARVIGAALADDGGGALTGKTLVDDAEGGARRRNGSGEKHIAFAEDDEEEDSQCKTKKRPGVVEKLEKALDWVLSKPLMAWAKPRMKWRDMKPPLRAAISMWIGFVLILIHESGLAMGMAAFLVLISSCMMPASGPFIQQIEIIVNLFFYLSVAWAWCALGVFVQHKVRDPMDPTVLAEALNQHPNTSIDRLAIDGIFLQARSGVVCSVWIFIGTAILLWWKMRNSPSPITFPCVLGCVLIDIAMTTAAIYPTPQYMAPFMVFKPIAIQAGIMFLCTIFVFPQSVTGQFRYRMGNVIDPLLKGMGEMEELFSRASDMPTFGHEDHRTGDGGPGDPDGDIESEVDDKLDTWGDRSAEIRQTLLKSLPGMQLLQGQVRYLKVDVCYGRLSGRDVKDMFDLLAAVQVRASGMSFFFNVIVNRVRHSHLDSEGYKVSHTMSAHMSRVQSRVSVSTSRPSSVHRLSTTNIDELKAPSRTPPRVPSDSNLQSRPQTPQTSDDDEHYPDSRRASADRRDSMELHPHDRKRKPKLHFPHFGPHSRNHSKSGLQSHKSSHLSLLESLRKAQQPVGVYESQRYMDVERGDERDMERVLQQLELLAGSSLPLVKGLRSALRNTLEWTKTGDRQRFAHVRNMQRSYATLKVMLEEFKEHRTEVISPYRGLFDPNARDHGPPSMKDIKHRGLYYCFVAQYHLIEFSEAVLAFMASVIDTDDRRQKRRVWFPRLDKLFLQFWHSVYHKQRDPDEHDDESMEEHEDDEEEHTLGEVRRRNPDFHPFDNPWMHLLSKLSVIPDVVFGRMGMYAIKVGVLGCLTTLPQFLNSSAAFYFDNRGVWCTIMAQMTLAIFAGDTFTSWMARMSGAFWGCLTGMVMWYIGSGHGKGNPFGMAAVTAVVFPFAMFYRCYYPSPIVSIVATTSLGLVIGYSWLNGNLMQLSAATWGWDVAWRRFVCVAIGITAAWIFSMVPPSYSAKRALRYSYASCIASAGRILCKTLSEANDWHTEIDKRQNRATQEELLRARAKLSKLGARHRNAQKEVSIRGVWPEDAYKGLLGTLVETMSLLAQFNHVLSQMDARWRKALLTRTRMNDPLFLGDVLAVISMCSSALRAGTPLPQITPGPLIAKYHMSKYKGLDLPGDPAGTHEDAPMLVTIDVLESDDYMRYALAVSTVYALMSRLDSIVVVCKTLLGENLHISNLRYDSQV